MHNDRALHGANKKETTTSTTTLTAASGTAASAYSTKTTANTTNTDVKSQASTLSIAEAMTQLINHYRKREYEKTTIIIQSLYKHLKPNEYVADLDFFRALTLLESAENSEDKDVATVILRNAMGKLDTNTQLNSEEKEKIINSILSKVTIPHHIAAITKNNLLDESDFYEAYTLAKFQNIEFVDRDELIDIYCLISTWLFATQKNRHSKLEQLEKQKKDNPDNPLNFLFLIDYYIRAIKINFKQPISNRLELVSYIDSMRQAYAEYAVPSPSLKKAIAEIPEHRQRLFYEILNKDIMGCRFLLYEQPLSEKDLAALDLGRPELVADLKKMITIDKSIEPVIYQKSKTTFVKAASAEPKPASTPFEIVIQLYRAKEYEKALTKIQSSETMMSNHPDTLFFFTLIFLQIAKKSGVSLAQSDSQLNLITEIAKYRSETRLNQAEISEVIHAVLDISDLKSNGFSKAKKELIEGLNNLIPPEIKEIFLTKNLRDIVNLFPTNSSLCFYYFLIATKMEPGSSTLNTIHIVLTWLISIEKSKDHYIKKYQEQHAQHPNDLSILSTLILHYNIAILIENIQPSRYKNTLKHYIEKLNKLVTPQHKVNQSNPLTATHLNTAFNPEINAQVYDSKTSDRDTAIQLFRAGKYNEAEDLFQKVMTNPADDIDPDLYFFSALNFFYYMAMGDTHDTDERVNSELSIIYRFKALKPKTELTYSEKFYLLSIFFDPQIKDTTFYETLNARIEMLDICIPPDIKKLFLEGTLKEHIDRFLIDANACYYYFLLSIEEGKQVYFSQIIFQIFLWLSSLEQKIDQNIKKYNTQLKYNQNNLACHLILINQHAIATFLAQENPNFNLTEMHHYSLEQERLVRKIAGTPNTWSTLDLAIENLPQKTSDYFKLIFSNQTQFRFREYAEEKAIVFFSKIKSLKIAQYPAYQDMDSVIAEFINHAATLRQTAATSNYFVKSILTNPIPSKKNTQTSSVTKKTIDKKKPNKILAVTPIRVTLSPEEKLKQELDQKELDQKKEKQRQQELAKKQEEQHKQELPQMRIELSTLENELSKEAIRHSKYEKVINKILTDEIRTEINTPNPEKNISINEQHGKLKRILEKLRGYPDLIEQERHDRYRAEKRQSKSGKGKYTEANYEKPKSAHPKEKSSSLIVSSALTAASDTKQQAKPDERVRKETVFRVGATLLDLKSQENPKPSAKAKLLSDIADREKRTLIYKRRYAAANTAAENIVALDTILNDEKNQTEQQRSYLLYFHILKIVIALIRFKSNYGDLKETQAQDTKDYHLMRDYLVHSMDQATKTNIIKTANQFLCNFSHQLLRTRLTKKNKDHILALAKKHSANADFKIPETALFLELGKIHDAKTTTSIHLVNHLNIVQDKLIPDIAALAKQKTANSQNYQLVFLSMCGQWHHHLKLIPKLTPEMKDFLKKCNRIWNSVATLTVIPEKIKVVVEQAIKLAEIISKKPVKLFPFFSSPTATATAAAPAYSSENEAHNRLDHKH